jgi:hypothetical protein
MAIRRRRPTQEDVRMKKTSLILPEPLWRATQIRALDEGTSFKQIVVQALQHYLKTATREKR